MLQWEGPRRVQIHKCGTSPCECPPLEAPSPQAAHQHGLTLIRWESHEYYLIGGLNPGGQGKRPMVRVVADVLLDMQVGGGEGLGVQV